MFISYQRSQARRAANQIRITHHALLRWQQRVSPGASPAAAAADIERLVIQGRSRPTARAWMRGTAAAPGSRFVYSAEFPGVAAILRSDAVLTIITKDLFSDRT